MFQGIRLQSDSTAARRRVELYCVDATDGITAETGEAGQQPQISTNGGSWTNTSATLAAIGNGHYYVELTSGELGTLGMARIRYKSANTAESMAAIQVGAFDVYSAASAGPSAAAIADAVWDEATTSHTTSGTFGEQLKTDVDAIKTQTDLIPASPAQQGTLTTISGYIDTEVAAIKAKTDLIPSDPAETSDIPSAATIAAAVWAVVMEGAYTAKEFMLLTAAVLYGKATGLGTTTVYFRDTADSKNRIVATVDSVGNRSSVTTDVS